MPRTTAPRFPSTPTDLHHAQITTRDIDRGDAPHFLLKEISRGAVVVPQDAPRQDRRGRRPARGRAPGPETLRPTIRATGCGPGRSAASRVIGQGTAAVAGQSLAAALEPVSARDAFARRGRPGDGAVGLRAARRHVRHARRRHQPERHHHRHEPDGRPRPVARASGRVDREPAQQRPRRQVRRRALHVGRPRRRDERRVHEGVLRADRRRASCSRSGSPARPACSTPRSHELLRALRELPDAMRRVVDQRDEIALVAQRHVLTRRYWAVVGNGVNSIAANELRIKLSELCYKAIACDVTEDKKHIDLSSEPLIIVCAVGLGGSHRRRRRQGGRDLPRPPRRTDRDRDRERRRPPRAALETIAVPDVHPDLDFVLATGRRPPLRLRGRARDRRVGPPAARGARRGRGRRARTARGAPRPARPAIEAPARRFHDGLRAGQYDGTLEASTAARVASLLRYATGALPLDCTRSSTARSGRRARSSRISPLRSRRASRSSPGRSTPSSTRRRPSPSASRAPTRRCCTSRSCAPCSLRRAARRAQLPRAPHARRPRPGRRGGHRVHAVPDRGRPRRRTTRRSTSSTGAVSSADLPSRTDSDPRLRGTKHRVATQREVTAVRGRATAARS